MKITSSNLIRFAGLALVPAGIVFAGIQPIHPPDVVESVTTTAWAVITSRLELLTVDGSWPSWKLIEGSAEPLESGVRDQR